VIFFQAAKKGERWVPTSITKQDSNTNRKQVKSLEPPKKPPPRPTTQVLYSHYYMFGNTV